MFSFFNHKDFKRSLFKIFFSFNLLIFICLLILSSIIFYKFNYMSHNRLILNSMSHTAKSLAKCIEKNDYSQKNNTLQNRTGLFAEYICVIDMQAKIISEAGKVSAELDLKKILSDKEIASGGTLTFTQRNVYPELLILARPIRIEGDVDGVLLIATSTKQSSLFTIGTVAITLALILCGYIIHTLLCQWYFYARIIKPLNEIISVTQIFSYGLSTNKLDIKSSFEFDKLSKSFNTMFDQIKQHIEELKLNTRLATIGEVTSELAHELKNKLGSSVFAIKQIADSGRLNERDKEMAEDIAAQLEDLIQLCKDFLDFAKPYELNFFPTDLNDIVDKVVKRNSLYFSEHKVEIKKIFAEDIPSLNIDPKRICEVMEILINNSVQAMRKNKNIEIKTFVEEGCVGFSVKDYGKGMDENAIEMAMEPFFTTKETGTGLGLPIAFKIIKEHKAFIDIKSKLLEGTEVIITFPF